MKVSTFCLPCFGILFQLVFLLCNDTHSLNPLARRTFLLQKGKLLVSTMASSPFGAKEQETDSVIGIPLEWVPNLNAYVVRYEIQGERFGAIVDTGSPFLTVPNYCDRNKWGCYNEDRVGSPTNFSPTIERFDNNEGVVYWKQGLFSFVRPESISNSSSLLLSQSLLTFGVLSESLMDGSGGVFLGLVRDTDPWIRPSFLSQLGVRSFALDLRVQPKLILSQQKTSIIRNDTAVIPLVKDLNKRYGDPAIHYTARAKRFLINGVSLVTDRRPIFVIFDSGVSGMVVSRELFDQRYEMARRQHEKSLWKDVSIEFETKSGKVVSLAPTRRPVTTPLGERPWPNFRGHLVVVGLAFLDGKRTVVDIDRGELQLIG